MLRFVSRLARRPVLPLGAGAAAARGGWLTGVLILIEIGARFINDLPRLLRDARPHRLDLAVDDDAGLDDASQAGAEAGAAGQAGKCANGEGADQVMHGSSPLTGSRDRCPSASRARSPHAPRRRCLRTLPSGSTRPSSPDG